MIQYRKILELYFKDVSQRTISTSMGSYGIHFQMLLNELNCLA